MLFFILFLIFCHPLTIIILLTTVFYIWGHAEKGNRDVVVDYSLQDNTEVVLGGGGE
jgi:succinate dehydrogenase hydrophobic anchor subunit